MLDQPQRWGVGPRLGPPACVRRADIEDGLEVDDDAMDGLLRTLFRALMDDWPYGVEQAVNVALLGRYYERFADHAVAIAQSVVFIVTGAKAADGPYPVG
jgi:phosphate transport system protein